MPTLTPPLPLPDLFARFTYDPATGIIAWRKTRGRYMRAGAEAGTITKHGDVVITVLGKKLPGPAVAWALAHNDWPSRPVYTRNGDRNDLRLDNLALRIGGARAPITEQRLARRAEIAIQQIDRAAYPHIGWSKSLARWIVRDSAKALALLDRRHARDLAKAADAAEALAISEDHDLYAEIAAARTLNPALLDASIQSYGIAYREIARVLAYDETTGIFVWSNGLRADDPEFNSPTSRRYIAYRGYKLYAHMLAWFYLTGDWPRPKQVIHVDGNKGNNTATNLRLRD